MSGIITTLEQERKEEDENAENYLYEKEAEQIEEQFRKRYPDQSKYPFDMIFFILDDLRKSVLVKGM